MGRAVGLLLILETKREVVIGGKWKSHPWLFEKIGDLIHVNRLIQGNGTKYKTPGHDECFLVVIKDGTRITQVSSTFYFFVQWG